MNRSRRAASVETLGWVGPFYPPGTAADRLLAWYARRFRTVEINNTFYRLGRRLRA